MARIADTVQVPGTDRRMSRRLRHIQCGRCTAIMEYDRGAWWSVVSELANEHWKACPGKPHVWPARMACTPTTPPDTVITLPLPVTLKQCSGPVAETTASQNHTWIASGCERKRRTLEQRKQQLEQDEYAKNVTTNSVVCAGCNKEISLDKRSKYYPGLWLKHRRKCPSLEKLERKKVIAAAQVSSGTGPAPYMLSSDSNNQGDMMQSSPAERYESHSAAATHQQSSRHSESDISSSEDDDGDEDLPSHEPFPTLNSEFYWNERHHNHSGEWMYRYATHDEIMTNLFHGQDESYARLGSRSFTEHVVETGGQSETSRCVITNRVEQAVSHPAEAAGTSTQRAGQK